MTAEQFRLILFFVFGSGLIPLIFYFFSFKNVPKEFHFIAICVALSTVCDFVGYQMSLRKIHNMLVTNSYFIAEFILLSCFFYHILFRRIYKKVFISGIVVFVIAFVYVSLFVQPFATEHQNFVWAASKFIFLVFGLIFIHEWTMSGRDGEHYKPHLWIIAGLIFHFGFALYIVVMYQALNTMGADTIRLVWSFHNLSYILKHLLFAVAFYLIPGKMGRPIRREPTMQTQSENISNEKIRERPEGDD
jgi:hypothetical protein